MRNASAASTGPLPSTAVQRRRRRRAAFVVAALAFFLWPMALEELAPVRLDTVRLTGIGGAGGLTPGGVRSRLRAGAARPIAAAQGALPAWRGFRLLNALPPGRQADLQTMTPGEAAISADLPAFGAPAAAVTSFNSPSPPPGPGPAPPFLTTPGGPTPQPPIVPLTPVDPPITPPVTLPDNPVTTPDPSIPPPIVAPFVAPPIGPGGPDPIKPFLPDPGGPGGGTQGGGPVAGIPEPGVWLELVVGSGLAGASLRRARRRYQPAMALRARSRARAVTTRLGCVFGIRFQASSAATL